MDDFRKITPIRRMDAPKGKRFKEYKPLLQMDFHCRCGYCGDHEFFRNSFYEIDHFVPRNVAKDKENDYMNLVYSCRLCNNSKRSKWPTGDPNLPNNGKEGWIDPCDAEFAMQFERISDGSVRSKTILGKWMWETLSLGNPTHRFIWLMEQLRIELKKTENMNIDNFEELQQVKKLYELYMNYEEQLRGSYSFNE